MKKTAKKDRKKKAAEIAAGIIREIRGHCQGVHIMALGWDDIIPDILDQAEIS